MTLRDLIKPRTAKELLYQMGVTFILFLFYLYSQDYSFKVEGYKVAFFANYFMAAMLINYVLVPKLYSQGKVLWFALSIVLLIVVIVVIDELGLP